MGFSSLTGLGARIMARNAFKKRIGAHRRFWVRRRQNRTSKAVANPVNFKLLNETSNGNNKFHLQRCTNKVDEEVTRKNKGRGNGSDYGNDCSSDTSNLNSKFRLQKCTNKGDEEVTRKKKGICNGSDYGNDCSNVELNLLNGTSNCNNKFRLQKCINKVDEEVTRKKKGIGDGSDYGNDCSNVELNLLNGTSNCNNRFRLQKCTNKADEEVTRKKKGRGNGSDYGNDCSNEELNAISDTIVRSSSGQVDDGTINNADIVMCEILSRLPVKSLARFKCVCKHWRFLIEKDPYFINLHLSRSRTHPSVFIIIPIAPKEPFQHVKGTSYIHRGYKNWFMTAELLFDEGQGGTASAATVHTIQEVDASSYNKILGPVNGLISFYDPVINSGVRISNISTRQVTPWIKSTLLRKFKEQERDFCPYKQDVKCEMGFNPATKEHKVICIWDISHSCPYRSEMICEVLTVGDNKWRKIAEVPPVYVLGVASVHVNGSIYYNTLTVREDKVLPTSIVAFDVGTEKFRTIGVPDFIVSQPRETDNVFGRAVDLLEVSGHMALLSRMNGYTVKLWLFNDTGNQNWTEVIIKLPYCWGGDRQVRFQFKEQT
ncbi:uncharacterized protein LOC113303594 [Papaver somniferum]|uniref:uncharacterized protein LOC113303594 n=1 Tax=Papaver somniferum TaxID=3469 RepID=UPI000E6F72A7|nr:uncharacterized protein LOC113303594 [Papaver somniferum]